MGINKITTLITAGLVVICALVILRFDKRTTSLDRDYSEGVRIENTWELPAELEEISGIVFLSGNRIAGVQDEKGTIFIYDLNSSRIEKRIRFGGSGDYEGIAVAGQTAYVIRSDGTILAVSNYLSNPEVLSYSTRLGRRHDLEGIFYDKEKERLLLAVKERDPNSRFYKGIYEFDPEQKKLKKEPAYKLTFKEKLFKNADPENLQAVFKPSELLVRPDGSLLLLEGEDPQLLVLDQSGKAKNLHVLNREDFPQPEGLALDSEGRLYISNEGNPATIQQVSLQ